MPCIKECLLFLFVLNFSTIFGKKNDGKGDISMSKIGFAQKYGYASEEHTVTTHDGYILSVYRLPNPKAKESILLVHGLMGSANDFLLLGPRRALGFILYESGYDVWMLNCRGSNYSQNHMYLQSYGPTANQYWNFTFHEIGYHDLPASVDYILKETNRSEIVYYGHSQGTTVLFIMLSERSEYNAKIKAAMTAAPTAFLCHSTNRILNFVMPFVRNGQVRNLRKLAGDFNVADIIPYMITKFLKTNCNKFDPMTSICLTLLFELVNATPSQVDKNLFPLLLKNFPHGGSIKQVLHFAQGVLACNFRKFQEDPNITTDDYNLENISTPIYGFIAENDTIQDPRDSMHLRRTLKNGFKETIFIKNWGHADFGIARDAPRVVYDKVLEILNQI